jgi:hypothetical protein
MMSRRLTVHSVAKEKLSRDGFKARVALDDDVIAILRRIALDLFVALDRFAGLAVDELPLHPMAGPAVDDVEGDAVGGEMAV